MMNESDEESLAEIVNTEPELANDKRLYAIAPAEWEAIIKETSEKEYCHRQMPGEAFFHLLMKGEIYLQKDGAKFCLACALRMEILTEDRLHWQHAKITSSENPL